MYYMLLVQQYFLAERPGRTRAVHGMLCTKPLDSKSTQFLIAVSEVRL